MGKAAEFLCNSRYKVYEIAGMVGYTDERYFSKVFKKQYGIIPEKYRNNHE